MVPQGCSLVWALRMTVDRCDGNGVVIRVVAGTEHCVSAGAQWAAERTENENQSKLIRRQKMDLRENATVLLDRDCEHLTEKS